MLARIRNLWQFSKRISDAFNRDSGSLMAAALSFYSLLSLVPLLSLGAAVLGWILGKSGAALPRLQVILGDIAPGNDEMIYKTLLAIKHDRGFAGLIGLTGLAVSASAMFINLELALNRMWRVHEARTWWRQHLVALGTTFLSLLLLLLSLSITSALTWMENWKPAGEISILWTTLGNLVPLAVSTVLFSLLYKIVPNIRVPWRCAVIGGLFTGIAWEAAKYGFALYMAHFARYNRLYGSLGAVVSLMIWAYYSSTILLIGAEITADHDTRESNAIAQSSPMYRVDT